MTRPRVILLNHTNPDHPGCRLTCDQLIESIGNYGDLAATYPTPRHEPDNAMEVNLDGVGVVVINGEGTMHHHHRGAPRPAVAELCRHAVRAKEAGCRVALINSVFENYDDDLSMFDYVSCRESRSFREAVGKHPCVDLTPDACFHYVVPFLPPQRKGIAVADSIVEDSKRMLRSFAKSGGHRLLRFRQLSLDKALRTIAGSELLITGRYHGLVFALMTRTPVLCVTSNTHKIEGLLEDFGANPNDPTRWPVVDPAALEQGSSVLSDKATPEPFVSDRELPPIADDVARMVRRAVLGETWEASIHTEPTDETATEWLRRRVRRLVTPRRRRHMVKFPSDFLQPMPAHPGYRAIHWRGRSVGRVRPYRPGPAVKRVAFIVASGPSINDLDLRPILDHTCVAVNGSIVKFQELGRAPDHYVVVAKAFVHDRLELLARGLASGAHCWLGSETLLEICRRDPGCLDGAIIHLLDPLEKRYGHDLIEENRLLDRFATDHEVDADRKRGNLFSLNPQRGVRLAMTVVYPALQVARYTGASHIGILGMDLSVDNAGGSKRFYEAGPKAAPTHLDSHYRDFIEPAFAAVPEVGNRHGFEVLNLSPTSRLPTEALPKVTLDEALARWVR